MAIIISDTSTMYSTSQARDAGFAVSPLAVTIAGESYRELDEMTHDRFVAIINEGHMPVSSQPAIGEVMGLYEEFTGEEILNIAMADGLSGTYSSAVAAAKSCENEAQITVLNSKTLCGPHRYMVERAVKMAKNGSTVSEIVSGMEKLMETAKSFLLPADFDYLRRGGRLSPLVSLVGKTIKLAPVLTQSEDGRQLVMSGVKRSFKQAIAHVIKQLEEHGVGAGWRIYVTHAACENLALDAQAALREKIPDAEYEIFPLTPAFITQGGPGCIAVQAIQAL